MKRGLRPLHRDGKSCDGGDCENIRNVGRNSGEYNTAQRVSLEVSDRTCKTSSGARDGPTAIYGGIDAVGLGPFFATSDSDDIESAHPLIAVETEDRGIS